MQNKKVYYLSVGILAFIGLALALYKALILGVPLVPCERDVVWQIEAKINFDAQDSAVKVSLILPPSTEGYKILEEDVTTAGYDYEKISVGANERAVWSAEKRSGSQTLYYRVTYYDVRNSFAKATDESPSLSDKPFYDKPELLAIEALVDKIKSETDSTEGFIQKLYEELKTSNKSENVKLLLNKIKSNDQRVKLIVDILTIAEIPAHLSKGIFLEGTSRNQPLYSLIEVYDGSKWICIDPLKGSIGYPSNFLFWQRGGISLIDVVGGRNSKVTFSVTKTLKKVLSLAKARTIKKNDTLFQYSLYNLPISEQNAFKALLLLPIAALIVVIMRVLVGLKTSGTFMPILIALAFNETHLLTGIVLFVIIVGLGLFIRFYLSRLNLLLVPRITAVIIIVIILMAAISIFSFNFGITSGLSITFFPLIILSWTIERMSICWEEQGYKEALTKTAGSLLIAIITYIVTNAAIVRHLTFFFPELMLVALALVLLLGNYTGYRLSELIRFQPMVEDK